MKKNGMFKKIIAHMLVLALAGGCLAGCGKADDGTVNVSVGNWPNAEAEPARYEIYEGRRAEFEANNEGITIQPDEWKYDVQTFLAKAEGKTLPDVYFTHFTEVNKIIEGGYSADIKDVLVKLGYYDKIDERMLGLIENEDGVFLIPNSCYTLGMALNLDLLEKAGYVEADGTPKAPKTMEELVEVAKAVTEKTGKAGFIFPTTKNQGGWYFTMLGWNYGVEFVKKENGKWVANFDNDDCVAALQYIKDLKWKYNVLPENTLVDMNECNKQIASGLAAMGFAPASQLGQMLVNYKMDLDDVGFTYIPAGPKNHYTLLGGVCIAFANTATETEIEAGLKWLRNGESLNPDLDEEYKKTAQENIQNSIASGNIVGVIDTAIWNEKSDVFSYQSQLAVENCNVNYNHVKLFNENKLDIHPEVEICAQELYGLLDACIQEVLNNKDADCKALISKAAADFQRNFLDYEN